MRGDDALQRFREADPLRGRRAATADELRARERLLAELIATPIDASPATPRRRRALRLGPLVAAVACAVLVAAAALDLTDPGTPGLSVIDRAIAAGERHGELLHVVEAFTSKSTAEDPELLDEYDSEGMDFYERERVHVESWYGPGGRSRILVSTAAGKHAGRVESEVARRPGEELTFQADANVLQITRSGPRRPKRRLPRLTPQQQAATRTRPPALAAGANAGYQLRTLRAQGRLRYAGEARVGGRRAFRLESRLWRDVDPTHTERVVFLVDARTYLPLEQRSVSTQQAYTGLPVRERPLPARLRQIVTTVSVRRFLVYEHLRATPANLAELELGPHPKARRLGP